ncbi:hypothetical protein EDD86DRAFT_248044 [Gorgonomyces haynaldii]|nr:hypothetical protein EDD86DRAFT_248044 [Gorgonomyces haynaldii]
MNKRTFLVTGCDSGLGYSIAHQLAQRGNIVYCGCLHPEDFQPSDGLIPVKLDITNQDNVLQVRQLIQKQHKSLYGLVNNAGIMMGIMTEWASMEQLEKTISVNLVGTIRMCKLLLPLLREYGPGSRIFNVASINAFISRPGFGGYCASKAGIKMFGAFKTPIQDQNTTILQHFDQAPPDVQMAYGRDNALLYSTQVVKSIGKAPDPSIGAQVIVKHLLTSHPPLNLLVGSDALFYWNTFQYLPLLLKHLWMGKLFSLKWNSKL